jgi:hypothetical protein
MWGCRSTASEPVLKAPTVSALETIIPKLLSTLAVNFNLRRHRKVQKHLGYHATEEAAAGLDR